MKTKAQGYLTKATSCLTQAPSCLTIASSYLTAAVAVGITHTTTLAITSVVVAHGSTTGTWL